MDIGIANYLGILKLSMVSFQTNVNVYYAYVLYCQSSGLNDSTVPCHLNHMQMDTNGAIVYSKIHMFDESDRNETSLLFSFRRPQQMKKKNTFIWYASQRRNIHLSHQKRSNNATDCSKELPRHAAHSTNSLFVVCMEVIVPLRRFSSP